MIILILNMMTLSYFVGNSFHLLSVSCAWFVWRKCSLQPAPTQKKKRKHEHRDSTCQTVTHLKMPLEKKIDQASLIRLIGDFVVLIYTGCRSPIKLGNILLSSQHFSQREYSPWLSVGSKLSALHLETANCQAEGPRHKVPKHHISIHHCQLSWGHQSTLLLQEKLLFLVCILIRILILSLNG